MCGIVGIASDKPVAARELLARRCAVLRHRGPDDEGAWWSEDGRVGLAQKRLAILDLSPGGHQPMADASGRLCITFNGEIYNYRDIRRELETRGHSFRSASDTEVILESYLEWGEDCLEHLNGMFAFGLYDKANRRLFLARDRAGEKPLFYYLAGNTLVFASELKALMADPAFPRRIDMESLDHYLAFGYVPGERCILQGVRKLPPAHAMTFDPDSGRLRVRRYWQLPEPAADADPDELLGEFERLLEDSVRRQLVADVPVGILLSGGIDSSLVTAMAARVSSRSPKTFTISFPGHGAYDEAPYARLVAKHFGTEHTELAAEPATVELLPMLARQYDEPIADSSMVPTFLVTRLVRRHATVALGGDGGDELFGGYNHYTWLQSQEKMRRLIPRPLRRVAGWVAARGLPLGFRGRNHCIGFAGDLPHSIAHVNLYFDAVKRRELLAPSGWSAARSAESYKSSLCAPDYSTLQMASRVDFQTTMADGYLVKVDRASMLNSLELRAPFLDHRLIEFAFGRVPDTLRAFGGERKILSRRLAERLLPKELDLKRKQGFSMPFDTWFRGPWGKYIEDVLGGADPGFFNRKTIAELVAGQRRGYSNAPRLFALTIFELWRREYSVEI